MHSAQNRSAATDPPETATRRPQHELTRARWEEGEARRVHRIGVAAADDDSAAVRC